MLHYMQMASQDYDLYLNRKKGTYQADQESEYFAQDWVILTEYSTEDWKPTGRKCIAEIVAVNFIKNEGRPLFRTFELGEPQPIRE